jgi:HD-like signal output (HDOD) protein
VTGIDSKETTMMASDVALDRDALRECVRSTLTRLSRTGELPALPATATAALGVARDPDAGIDELCGIIRVDVGLSARILRVANSAAYARRTPAKTLKEAVLTVGLRKTCDLLVAAAARKLFETGHRAEHLWNHALAAGIAAEELARVTRRVEPATAFLPGLFHDVGRIAFLLADPLAYDVIRGLVHEGAGSPSDLERSWYGFDHAEAGAILAEDWGLGTDQCEGIRWHHRPAEAETGRHLAAILEASDALAYAIGCGVHPGVAPVVDLGPLAIEPDRVDAFQERVREAFVQQNELLR